MNAYFYKTLKGKGFLMILSPTSLLLRIQLAPSEVIDFHLDCNKMVSNWYKYLKRPRMYKTSLCPDALLIDEISYAKCQQFLKLLFKKVYFLCIYGLQKFPLIALIFT